MLKLTDLQTLRPNAWRDPIKGKALNKYFEKEIVHLRRNHIFMDFQGKLLKIDEMSFDHVTKILLYLVEDKIPEEYLGGKEYWIQRLEVEMKNLTKS